MGHIAPKSNRTIRFSSALISTAPTIGSNGSSTGSSNVVGLRRATTSLPPIYLAFVQLASIRPCLRVMSPRPGTFIRHFAWMARDRRAPLGAPP